MWVRAESGLDAPRHYTHSRSRSVASAAVPCSVVGSDSTSVNSAPSSPTLHHTRERGVSPFSFSSKDCIVACRPGVQREVLISGSIGTIVGRLPVSSIGPSDTPAASPSPVPSETNQPTPLSSVATLLTAVESPLAVQSHLSLDYDSGFCAPIRAAASTPLAPTPHRASTVTPLGSGAVCAPIAAFQFPAATSLACPDAWLPSKPFVEGVHACVLPPSALSCQTPPSMSSSPECACVARDSDSSFRASLANVSDPGLSVSVSSLPAACSALRKLHSAVADTDTPHPLAARDRFFSALASFPPPSTMLSTLAHPSASVSPRLRLGSPVGEMKTKGKEDGEDEMTAEMSNYLQRIAPDTVSRVSLQRKSVPTSEPRTISNSRTSKSRRRDIEAGPRLSRTHATSLNAMNLTDFGGAESCTETQVASTKPSFLPSLVPCCSHSVTLPGRADDDCGISMHHNVSAHIESRAVLHRREREIGVLSQGLDSSVSTSSDATFARVTHKLIKYAARRMVGQRLKQRSAGRTQGPLDDAVHCAASASDRSSLDFKRDSERVRAEENELYEILSKTWVPQPSYADAAGVCIRLLPPVQEGVSVLHTVPSTRTNATSACMPTPTLLSVRDRPHACSASFSDGDRLAVGDRRSRIDIDPLAVPVALRVSSAAAGASDPGGSETETESDLEPDTDTDIKNASDLLRISPVVGAATSAICAAHGHSGDPTPPLSLTAPADRSSVESEVAGLLTNSMGAVHTRSFSGGHAPTLTRRSHFRTTSVSSAASVSTNVQLHSVFRSRGRHLTISTSTSSSSSSFAYTATDRIATAQPLLEAKIQSLDMSSTRVATNASPTIRSSVAVPPFLGRTSICCSGSSTPTSESIVIIGSPPAPLTPASLYVSLFFLRIVRVFVFYFDIFL